MQGLDLSESYFRSLGLPMLERRFGDHLERVAAGLVGDGSECFRFDDNISRDHDWGPGFCIWLTERDYDEIGIDLQEALDELPAVFSGYGPRRPSPWADQRLGVFSIRRFYEQFLGLDHVPLELDEWLMIPESSLATCTNGDVFWDPLGEFSRWRDALLAYYPEDVRKKKLASRCMTLGQAGQYNFPRCVARGEDLAARYAEIKFCTDVISAVFLLNHRYTPYFKWMHRATKQLPILGTRIHGLLSELILTPDRVLKQQLIEIICAELVNELTRQSLTTCTSSFLPDHGAAIQDKIHDPELRKRNVWVG
jgi:hypothetical protein